MITTEKFPTQAAKPILFALAFAVSLLLPRISLAQLQFTDEALAFDAKLGQEETVARYPFVNVGDETVTISEVKASCGCTVPFLAKKVYEPGERGEIVLTFKHENRMGPQSKSAYIRFASGEAMKQLKLKVDIPYAFKTNPPLLYWKDASATEAMSAELQFFTDGSVSIEEVKSLNPAWEVRAEPRKDDPSLFDLIATPVGDIKGQRGTVLITTKPELRNIRLYLRGH